MAPWHHRQVICWNWRESDNLHLCLLSPQRETWTFKEWELKRYRFCSLCGHGVTFLCETILCHHHIWHQTNSTFRRHIIAGFKEVFTTHQVTCVPQQGISKERSRQVHSTCYKFVSLPISFEGSRTDPINKTDHMKYLNGMPRDSSVMSKVLTKLIWHVWWKLICTTWNTSEVNQTFEMTTRHRRLSAQVKRTVTILVVAGLFV